MKRPALYIGFPFTAGLVLAAAVRSPLLCGGIVLLSLALIVWRRAWWKYVLLSTLSLLTACCVYWQTDAAVLQKQSRYAGQETAFTGQIVSLTAYDSGWTRCVLDGTLSDALPARVQLFTDETGLVYGDTLTLSGTPELLSGSYLFDSAGYARSQRICLQYCSDADILSRTPLAHPTVRSVIWHWRMEMTDRIRSQMRPDSGAMLTGMLFGDKSGMSDTGKSLFYRMGIGHLLAVSGLHLEFLALCIAWLLRQLSAGRKLVFLCVTVFGLAFVICAGETVSVWRAFVMTEILYGAALVFRERDTLNSLSIAMLILGIVNPYVIHSAAFWLSCAGTWGIGVLGPYMTQEMPEENLIGRGIKRFCIFVWTFLAVLPVSALYFREVSFLSPLSNAVLVPICMAALLLGVLAILCTGQGLLAVGFLRLSDLLCGVILDISGRVGVLPFTHAPTSGRVLLPLLFGGVLLAVLVHLLEKHRRVTAVTVAAAFAVTFGAVGTEHLLTRRDLHIALLGSGRSSAAVLTAGEEALLIDLSGVTGTVAHTEAYLTDAGCSRVKELYLCRPGQKILDRCEEKLGLYPPEHLVLLDDRRAELPGLFDAEAEFSGEREFLFHGARLHITQTAVTVDFAGNTVYICTDPTDAPEHLTALMVAGKCRDALPESGILIVTDAYSPYTADDYTFIGENDLELTLTETGRCRVRRLYGES